MAELLLERGVYVIGFSYPVVPQGKARIRVQLSAAHSHRGRRDRRWPRSSTRGPTLTASALGSHPGREMADVIDPRDSASCVPWRTTVR